LESEGNAWLRRNAPGAKPARPESDPLLQALHELPAVAATARTTILEIGCGGAERLDWLRTQQGFDAYGVEPSSQAVTAACGRGLAVQQGTAERLPFGDSAFDVVMFGFCLYLCDREDLFCIACEADRVLKNPGWLLILDFYSPWPSARAYAHRPGLFSHKMDYRTLFTWNPAYINYSHKILGHLEHGYTDDPQEWVATSVLRKNLVRA